MSRNLLIKSTLTLLAILFLAGCTNAPIWDPKGPVGDAQKGLIVFSVLVMLLVVVPVIIMSIVIPMRYRTTNKKAEYKPLWEHSNLIELVVWAIPIAIIIVLAIVTYQTSHSLDPRQPIESDKEKMVVQVVALDWKWLFIYPEEQIATVNELAIPVNTPVEFLVTSGTVMNSFFIPSLGSQIYAMSGMENRLNLLANEEGVYPGISANYSGFGFSGMKFKTHATSQEEFDAWVAKVKNTQNPPLDDAKFAQLEEKTRDVKPMYFSSVNPLLFNNIVKRFTGEINE